MAGLEVDPDAVLGEEGEGTEALVDQVRILEGDVKVVEKVDEDHPHLHHGQVAAQAVAGRNCEGGE